MVAAHRVVDVNAETMPLGRSIAIEQWREDTQRYGGREKTRIGRQRRNNAAAKLARDLAVGRQLLVTLYQRRLRAGGRTAVLPRATVHDAAEVRRIGLAQHFRYANQHRFGYQNRADITKDAVRPGASRTNGAELWYSAS